MASNLRGCDCSESKASRDDLGRRWDSDEGAGEIVFANAAGKVERFAIPNEAQHFALAAAADDKRALALKYHSSVTRVLMY